MSKKKRKELIKALEIRLRETELARDRMNQSDAPYETIRFRIGYYEGKAAAIKDLLEDLEK